ncbi:glycosyltransferase [Amylibacter sp.]|nr:glycosyltransferase [Amylibacter sp.]
MYVVFTMSLSLRSGGLFTSVRKLTTEIYKYQDVVVLSGKDGANNDELFVWKNLKYILTKKFRPYWFGFMPFAIYHLIRLKPSVIHCHGVWSFNALCTLLYKMLFPSTFIIISPRGMLDDWSISNKTFKKKIALVLYTRPLIQKADIIHALCKNEKYQVEKKFKVQNVIVVPNGIDGLGKNLVVEEYSGDYSLVIGYIGRLHQKKGLEYLIDAIALLRGHKVLLRIAGFGDESYVEKLKVRVHKLKLETDIEFVGVVRNQKKEMFINSCDVTILPSYSEGLPMSVLESWSYGKPTFITKECNFIEINDYDFAVQIKRDPSDISEKLRNYINLERSEKEKLSALAKHHVKEKYFWENIGKQFWAHIKNAKS